MFSIYCMIKVFRDVAWEREILSLRVKCKKRNRGCDWTGQLQKYKEHFVVCEYEDQTCGDCNETMQRRFLHKHITSECLNRMVQCEHCGNEFAYCQTERHEDIECSRFPVNCPQECGEEMIPREEVESHVRDDCVMTMVNCTYEEAGCAFYDQRRNLKAHLEASTEEHLSRMWSKLLETKEKLNDFEVLGKCMSEMRLQCKENQAEIEALRELVQTMENKVKVNEENQRGKPKNLRSKKYSGKKMDVSRSRWFRRLTEDD